MSRVWSLLRAVHEDEQGAVSLETVLIIGAIALPILLFLYKWAWPKIRDEYFKPRLDDLMNAGDTDASPSS